MEKLRQKIYIENATNEILDELYEKFKEVDFMYNDKYIRFYGSPERLQELLRYCSAEGIVIKK